MGKPNKTAKDAVRFDLQRRVVAHMTSSSWKNVPHVSYLYEPDITAFYDAFQLLAQERSEKSVKLSFNTLMLKTIVEGLRAAPELNAFIRYHSGKSTGSTTVQESINISLPWLLPNGKMITPVIPDAEKMSLDEISAYILRLACRIENTNIDEMLYRAARADTIAELKRLRLLTLLRILPSRSGGSGFRHLSGRTKREYYQISEENRLTEKDIMTGTVTVSNVGSLYKGLRGGFGLLEVIPPQIFAVGVGALQEKPGVYETQAGEKEIGIRKTLPMCLAFDHRAVDFAALIPFVQKLDEIFAHPDVICCW